MNKPDAESKNKLLLGVDIGGTKCSITVGNAAGIVLEKNHFLTTERDETLARIVKTVSDYKRKYPEIICGGVSCGGPMDTALGLILSPPNLPSWDRVPIIQVLREATGTPFALENDANASALAEWHFGHNQGCEPMVFLTFGTGLGAGIIANGGLLRGASGSAGEVGHLRLCRSVAESLPAGFGKEGSFEGFCSGGGVAQYIPTELQTQGVCSVRDLAGCVRTGNAAQQKQALATFETLGRWLGYGLALLVDTLNPQRIVLGSIFVRCESWIRPTMEQVLAEEALPGALAACKIVPASLGEDLGDIAALGVALELQRNYQQNLSK